MEHCVVPVLRLLIQYFRLRIFAPWTAG